MKKVVLCFFIGLFLTGCSNEPQDLTKENKELIVEDKKVELSTVRPSKILNYIIDEDSALEGVRDEKGQYAGWESELSGGCGWWCTVEDSKQEANASSTLKSDGSVNYSSGNVYKMSRNNSWVEGAVGDGVGEYIELTKQFLCYEGDNNGGRYGEICIVTGYAKNEQLWRENNRVKTLLMYINGEPYKYLELEDTIKPQYFNVWGYDIESGEANTLNIEPSKEMKFKFEIKDVYKGTKYEDTAITFLDVEFLKGH